jgi:hypothetical protein
LRYQGRADDPPEEAETARERIAAMGDRLCGLIEPEDRGELEEERRDAWDDWHSEIFPRRPPAAADDLVRRLQRSLRADDAVLYYYWAAPDELLITAVDRSRFLTVLRRPGEWRERLDELAAAVLGASGGNRRDGSLRLLLEEVEDFSNLLLPCQMDELLDSKRRLLCSPHGVLHAVPLHALIWRGRRLIDSLAVRYVPNLMSTFHRWTPRREGEVLVAGVSDYISKKPLPAAERECAQIADLHHRRNRPVTLLTGRQANRSAFTSRERKADLARYRCLHLAVHGENIDSDRPMESRLSLSDADIDGLELSTWRLDADLAILSACCSGQRPFHGRGLEEELPGDDLFGLQAALAAAGVKQVVSALWPVADSAAAEIMREFHSNLDASFAEPEEALRQAMIDYRGKRKPMVMEWAPFFVAAFGSPAID